MNKYHDRGIMKWAPFDSLSGFGDMMDALKYQLNKQEKPELCEDALDALDLCLKEAFEYKLPVTINLFKSGYMISVSGKITCIDKINQVLYIDQEKHLVTDIISMFIEQK